jgi:hypothetical protein
MVVFTKYLMSTQYTKFYQTLQDPVVDARSNGKFQLFFSERMPIASITPNYTIDSLVKEINTNIDFFGLDCFEYTDHRQPTVDISQFVKINKLYHNLKSTPNIKPWLLYAINLGIFTICGESRLRAMELLPDINHVAAFINVPVELQHQYTNCTRIDTFDQFARSVGCDIGTPFWFTVSDQHGIDWYEVAIDNHTGTNGQRFRDRCIDAIRNYVKTLPGDFKFSKEWFTQTIDWDQYVLE